jgi:hypothetical protein
MISNTTNYSPAFGARLKVETFVKNRERLNHIQKLFSEKTSRYPDETLRLSLNEYSKSLQGTILKEGKRESVCQILPRSVDKMMEDISDNDMAKKLVRFFKGIKVEDKASAVEEALENHHDTLMSKAINNRCKSEVFKIKGDEKMSATFNEMADRMLKQAKKLEIQLQENKNHAIDTLEKVSKGDKDLMYSFEVTSSVM